jgi:regulator of replication initiation timing
MNLIKGFFIKYAVVILVALLLGSIVFHQVVIFGLKSDIKSKGKEISTLQTKVGSLEAENAVLVVANTDFKTLTETQNLQIQKFQQEEETRKLEYKKNKEQDRKEITKWRGAYEFLNTTRPRHPTDTLDTECDAFFNKLDKYIDLRQQEVKSK